jgi:AcrR family transcriptional regulator
MTKIKINKLSKHNENINKIVRESIQQALIILMNQKKFNDISITELCKKAGVSRMAFYNNYNSKDDLLKQLIYYHSEFLINEIGSPFREKTNNSWYVKMFEYAKENHYNLKTIFDAGFKYEYLSTITDIVLHDKDISLEKKYLRVMWTGGIINTIIYWLESGMKESIDEIATFCYKNLSVWTNE